MNDELSTTRRNVVKGAAWGVPAISVAVAAPAIAASVQAGILGASTYTDTEKGSGMYSGEVSTVPKGAGFTVTPSGTSAVVRNVTVWYWLPSPNYSFTPVQSGGWSTPVRDTSRPTVVGPTTGLTYYAYKMTYAGVASPVTSGPVYDFTANNVAISTEPGGSYYYQISATVDGRSVTNAQRAVCGQLSCP